MSNITITVDKALKKTMKELKGVNWSEVARAAFEEKIEMERRKKATQAIKEIRRKSKTKWSGSEEIRKWRDMTR
ncbi:MAG: hypothetical protein HYU02_00250 [Thaumarchaeota archaeon]|nr:hypothetical protein [Nitrososphaerota archaeon]